MNIEEYTNELFQNKLKKYPRRKVLAYYPNDIFSADLVDMSRLKSVDILIGGSPGPDVKSRIIRLC